MPDICDNPSEVTAENGVVLIDGPAGAVITMTAEAAAETSDRLLHAATLAAGQLVEARRLEEERAIRRQSATAPKRI